MVHNIWPKIRVIYKKKTFRFTAIANHAIENSVGTKIRIRCDNINEFECHGSSFTVSFTSDFPTLESQESDPQSDIWSYFPRFLFVQGSVNYKGFGPVISTMC